MYLETPSAAASFVNPGNSAGRPRGFFTGFFVHRALNTYSLHTFGKLRKQKD
jgi:hypothetical protein